MVKTEGARRVQRRVEPDLHVLRRPSGAKLRRCQLCAFDIEAARRILAKRQWYSDAQVEAARTTLDVEAVRTGAAQR
jgi:hypothetical protein